MRWLRRFWHWCTHFRCDACGEVKRRPSYEDGAFTLCFDCAVIHDAL